MMELYMELFIYLFLCLLIAHVIGDFYCQTERSCERKRDKNLIKRAWALFFHAIVIFGFSWIVTWSWSFWLAALIICGVHFVIDAIKAPVENCRVGDSKQPLYKSRYAVWPLVVDQVLHIAVIAFVAWWWLQYNSWEPEWFEQVNRDVLIVILLFLFCGKPANLLTKDILRFCQVKVMQNEEEKPKEQNGSGHQGDNDKQAKDSNFKAGALIGSIERWLIVFFMLLHQYEAIGFLIAAKSILRFRETQESEKSEYVLAGTLTSIAIAVVCGAIIMFFTNEGLMTALNRIILGANDVTCCPRL